MMRSLWTAATGMIAQQTNVDTIANNLSNVNTAGYKKQAVQFQSLLYAKLQTKTTDNNGDPKPVIGQVGTGARVSGLTSIFTQGSPLETGNPYDFAIDGSGFFQVVRDDGSTAYTRNGSFQMAIGTDGVTLATADGCPVLSSAGEPIVLEADWDVMQVSFDIDGNLCYPDAETGIVGPTGIQIGLVQFNNPAGLEKLSDSLYAATDNSGVPRSEAEDEALKKSRLINQYIEGSNVQTVDEVVNLIVAQRAYEMNSKAIQASDEMLQQANNLRQ